MSEQESEAVAQEGADLEYDLAHEASGETAAVRSRQPEQRDAVVTATPEYDGDYSYDLAHDVPPSR
jgi:NAD(P)H-dependent FMN reductase